MANRAVVVGGIVLGGGALAGAGVLAVRAVQAKGTPATPTLILKAVSSIAGAPGSPLTATLTFSNNGAATPAQTVPVGISLAQGSAGEKTIATATVPALAAHATAQVSITSEGPIGQFQSGSVQVVFALANGSTISGTFQVSATAAAFQFVSGSLSISSPVQVGQYATASMQVKNTGGTAGVPAVSGVTEFDGTTEGHWSMTNGPSIPANGVGTVNMRTNGAVAAQFAGSILTAVFAVA